MVVLLIYLLLFVRVLSVCICLFFFFKQKTAYEMRISDWSSDVCSSDLPMFPFRSTRSIALEAWAPFIIFVRPIGLRIAKNPLLQQDKCRLTPNCSVAKNHNLLGFSLYPCTRVSATSG